VRELKNPRLASYHRGRQTLRSLTDPKSWFLVGARTGAEIRGREKVSIEVVTFGSGLNMLRDDTSPVKARIEVIALGTPEISFKACGNTRENMQRPRPRKFHSFHRHRSSSRASCVSWSCKSRARM
jgi:hypothetical protein